jgi:opacity protein-like surface antigen
MTTTYLAIPFFAITTSLANASGYIGASDGQADIDESGFDNSTSFSLTGGYKFTDNFAIEVSYIDLGDSDDDIAPVWTVEADGFDFSVVGILPVSEKVDLFAKVGAFMWDATIDEEGFGEIASDDGTDLSYGLGAAFKLNENFNVSLQYQMFDLDDTDVSNISLGVGYNF